VKKLLPLAEIVDRLRREEQQQKRVGGYGAADGLQLAVTIVLRMADAEEESIEPSSEET
jgi:hypothetical protein